MISKTTIKYIQSLQHKKFRDEHNVFIAEGPKVVNELLQQNNFECDAIYCTELWANNYIKTFAGVLLDKINVVKDFELEKISALTVANQVLAVFQKRHLNRIKNISNLLTIMLDDVQDPGNLGTIIRIADWFGINYIICSNATADCYNPKVVQSTMASLGRVNVIYTDLKSFLEENKNIKKYAALLKGKDIRSAGKIKEGIIIFGNESRGLSKELVSLVDEKLTIEKIGEAESLNVSVAVGIILYAIT